MLQEIDIQRKPYDSEFDRMDILPRWAYSDSEYCDLVLLSDKIIDGTFYVKIEPTKKNDIDLLFEQLINGEIRNAT